MLRTVLTLTTTAAVGACLYEPPRHDAAWYDNPEAYVDERATHPRREAFQAYLDAAVDEGLPGAALLVRTPDGTWVGAAGLADVAGGVPWQPEMIGRIGSATKTLAAAVILRLVDDGALALDDRIAALLAPEVIRGIANADEATVRHLLTNTSGIFDYIDDAALLLATIGSYDHPPLSLEERLAFARGHDALYPVGTDWNYSSTNFLLLELVAEAVTGRDSRALMRELVIEPLALRSTTYDPLGPTPDGLTRGYADMFGDGEPIDVTDTALERFDFDGGVISNVHDLAAMLDGVLGPAFLSADTLAALTTAVDTRGHSDKGTDFYGAGLIIERHPELGEIRGHSGTALGHTAHVYRIVEADVTIAAIVNGSQMTFEDRSYRWFSPLRFDDVARLAVP